MDDANFSSLPLEIKNIIVSHLDERSRRMMRSTSTEWFYIINNDEFTIYFARPTTLPDLIQTFSRYSKPIGLRFEKTISIDSSFTSLALLTNLTKLEVEPSKHLPFMKVELDLRHFTALTKLQHFAFGRCNILPHLQHFEALTKLVIEIDYNLEWKHLDDLQHLTNLKEFAFYVPYCMKSDFNVVSKFGNYSALKELTIHDDEGVITFDEESVAKMSNLSKVSMECRDVLFPFSKLPNLESLRISCDRFDDFSTCTKLTWLSIEVRGTKRQQPPPISAMNHDYQQLAALHNLRDLSLRTALKEDQFNFLSKMTDLRTLSVYEKTASGLTGKFLEFVNSSKLKTISVPAIQKMEFISHLTSLEIIRVFSAVDVDPNCSVELRNVKSLTAPDIIPAKVLPNLEHLDIRYYHNPEQTELDRVSRLVLFSQLESLSLPTIGNEMLQAIAMHTKLTELHVEFDRNTTYDFEALDRLTNLKILVLRADRNRNKLSKGALWQAISHMTNLEALEMFHINEKSVDILKKLPKLKQLAVVGKQAASFDETQLQCLTNLQVLRLASGYLFNHHQQHKCKLNLPYLYNCSDY